MPWTRLSNQFFRLFVTVVEPLRRQFFTDFHRILHASQKCGRFDAYGLWDKLEERIGFNRCANSKIGSFQAFGNKFVNVSAQNSVHVQSKN